MTSQKKIISKSKQNQNKTCIHLQRKEGMVTPTISFVGTSNSGKTTLLEKVVRELKVKGYRVAVIKHTHHDFEIDQPGKDTWRMAQAGSDIIAISSPNKMAIVERVDEELTLAQLKTLFGQKVDIVLTEGYKNTDTAKILVLDDEQQEPLRCQGEILAAISARFSPLGVRQFDHEDVLNIVNLVIKQIAENPSRSFGDVSEELFSL